MEYVFVVTYGRSGSTLVQGMLNTMPRTLVRGENGLYVQHLFRAWQATDEIRQKRKGPPARKATNAFYGINALTRARFVRSAHRLVVGGILGSEDEKDFDRIGFKEVDWHQIAPEETEPFFDWLEEVCPDAKYILNTRDVEQVLGSGFWQRQETDEAMARDQPGDRDPGPPARDARRPGARDPLRGHHRRRQDGVGRGARGARRVRARQL